MQYSTTIAFALMAGIISRHPAHAQSVASPHTTSSYNLPTSNVRAEPADPWLPAGWRRIPRLQVQTTFVQRDTTIADAVRALRLSTGARLQAEGNEVLPSHVSLRYHDVPLADVLRGMAAARNLVWTRTQEGELLLHQRRRAHALDVFHPHTEAEAEMWRLGQELVKQANSLPPDMQQELQQSPATSHKLVPEGTAFTDLPPAMQQTVHAMYAAHVQTLRETGSREEYVPADNLSSTRVRMEMSDAEGMTSHRFVICADKAGEDMYTRAFHDSKEGNGVVPLESIGTTPLLTYPEDAAMQQEAQADACLKTHVSLTTGSYMLEEVLLELAKQGHFHFAMPVNFPQETRRFRCIDEPLSDVLPRLCHAFAYTAPHSGLRWEWSWNWRKGDFFVFHTRPDTTKPNAAGKPDATHPAKPSLTQSK